MYLSIIGKKIILKNVAPPSEVLQKDKPCHMLLHLQ